VEHIERITQLIIDICGGEAGPVDDQQVRMPERPPVTLRIDRAAKVIGMPVSQAQCAGVMSRLGLTFTEAPGSLVVTPPSWRFDLQIEEDLIEEVIRILGYDSLPLTAPKAPIAARVRVEALRSAFAVRHLLADLDYQETINFSFVEARWEHELAGNADPIKVLNPIAAPLSVMRSSLVGSLVQVLRHNLARKAGRVRVFEIGRVAMRDASVLASDTTVAGVHQPMRVAGLAFGPADATQWGSKERTVDFFDVKGDVERLLAPQAVSFKPVDHPALHPGRSAQVLANGVVIGVVGELHPRWRQAYELSGAPVLFELDLAAVLARQVPAAQSIAKHQATWRDLALVVPESATHDGLVNALRDDPSGLVKAATLFDVYKPAAPVGDMKAGERSMAVRIELLDLQATLTEERIDAAVADAVARVALQVGARLRA
jgi:phenylalanyl-tRNA synthetase beta chain